MIVRSAGKRMRVVAVLACMFLVSQAYGYPDIYVSPGGGGSGTSWGDATTLANALATASANDVIWMQQGTYTDASTFSISTDGLQIYGGFAGTETNLSQRNWTNNVVLLDGQNARRVVDILANNVLLDGLIITNGFQNSGHGSGIRMENSGTGLTMLNCHIDGNRHSKDSGYGAGAYFSNAGNVLLSNTVFRSNRATIRCLGVGFRSDGTTLTLRDCEIRDSYDSGGDQRPGKGFYLGSGTLTMVNTIVADNYYDSDDGRRPGPGGGGYIAGGTASFTNCIFTGNDSDRSDGSGLYVNNANVTIESCTFVANGTIVNREESRGGAIFQNSGTVTIRNSIFWGNEAGTSSTAGDTIYQNSGTLNISYSCFDGIELPRMRFLNGTWGDGIITNNPLFAAEYTDIHLKSKIGRWNGSIWVTDAQNSPCIDAGDPTSDYSKEPTGADGAWINMGAYGNTWQASKSTNEAPAVETVAERVVATAAELRGQLTAGAVSAITFYYGLGNGGETPSNWDATNILNDAQSVGNIFSSVASDLQDGQTYWFTVRAANAFGTNWSTPRSFSAGSAAPGGGAGVIHVDPDATGIEEGLSWTNAFTTFEGALAAAEAGLATNIWIADGLYESLDTFVVRSDGLHIYGGFDGAETNLMQRDWTNNVVLLDGQNTRRVVDIQANNVLLDGLTITNGFQNSGNGSGIRLENSGTGLTMLNCRIVGNRNGKDSGYGAGAYFNNAGSVLLSNTVIRANITLNRGQGVGFRSDGSATSVTLVDCEIRDNVDTGGDMRPGKGFYLGSGTLTMVNTIVAGNYYGSTDSRVAGDGGGGYINSGTASFTNCAFTENDSNRSDGSGLYINNGTVTIENCTFAGNGTLLNRDESRGGAIYQSSGTVTIRNSILWGNVAGISSSAGDMIYQAGGTMSIGYSCLEGTSIPYLYSGGTLTFGSGNITNDPLFAVEYSDVHLQSIGGHWDGSKWVKDSVMSPCIDAGDPASDYSREPGKNGERINMGAYGNTPEASRNPTYGTVLVIR